ncbi:MAG: UDP-2,3-diacylglucosamine diphosphatase, partial [Gammaproteobacteria bacterium]
MNEAVFISDLHLHPEQPAIREKFRNFVSWAVDNTEKLYILGDFLHVWPGDDAMDAWTESIAADLAKLADHGISVYFMPGNRDFLIGRHFLQKAKLQPLNDPTVIHLGDQAVLLSHGDAYCSHDFSHQGFRRLTRNRIFRFLFLSLPYCLRKYLVGQVRHYSQNNRNKSVNNMQTVEETMYKDLTRFASKILIHGHTHQPGLRTYGSGLQTWREYTL